VLCDISMNDARTLFRVLVFACCSLPMLGQTANTGAIGGTVGDPSGALIPRAAVAVNSQNTGEKRNLTTDTDGNFSAQLLAPGNYEVTVDAQGFEPLMLKDVQFESRR
jgi:hypothetical protein